jgi:hypothetical protein
MTELAAWREWAAGVTKREAPDDLQRRTIASVIEAPAVTEVPGDADASTDLSDADLVFLARYVATRGDGGFVKPLVREIQRRRAREATWVRSVDDLTIEACARVAYDASRAARSSPEKWDDCHDGAKVLHCERARAILTTGASFAGQPVFDAAVRAVRRALDGLEVATAPVGTLGAVDSEMFAKFKRDYAANVADASKAVAILDPAPRAWRSATTGSLDQPPPVPQPDRVPVWEVVISDFRTRFADNFDGIVDDDAVKYVGDHALADMRERDQVGRARYGTPLTTGNGRDHLVDAYREVLDAAAYLRAAWLDGAQVFDAYYVMLDMVMSVRKRLDARAVAG